jgi:hypothetical protein
MTGKRLKGRLGGGAGYTVRTDDVPALPDQPNASDTGTQTCRNPATFS